MALKPRPYRDTADLDKMCALLQAGRAADNGTYYIHTGDLKWWIYYPAWEHDLPQHIYLRDDPANPSRLLGWTLLSPRWGYLDTYVQPELMGTPQAESMYAWAEEKIEFFLSTSDKDKFYVMWVSQADKILNEHFRRRGFQRTPDDVVYMTRSLVDQLPAAPLPEGTIVRSSAGKSDLLARARAQYGAFGSEISLETYAEGFRSFILSPVYDPNLDIVAATPDGQIGSFCIIWPDPVNKVGLFEPVGTHPDFQRRGLGRSVMLEGLRRLRERGMTEACVSTNANNSPAVKLYESVGFHTVDIHVTYTKDL